MVLQSPSNIVLTVQLLEGLGSLWQAKVAAATQVKQGEGKQETPPVPANSSLKVLAELCQTGVFIPQLYTCTLPP